MDTHSLNVLELSAIQQRLGAFACSEPGKGFCLKISPNLDREQIESSLSEIQQAKEALSIYGRIPISGLMDIKPILIKASQPGFCLEIHDFLVIRKFMEILVDVTKWLKRPSDTYKALKTYSERLIPLKELYRKLDNSLSQTGEVKDTASPALAKIRKQIRQKKEEIIHLLEGIVKESEKLEALQGDFITIRNGRYVIPIKTQRKSAINGIIHDESDSGATIFIEPLACIELQNSYRRLKIKEDEEIKRILTELSTLISNLSKALENNLEITVQLDYLQAKVLFCESIKGITPIISSEPVIKLKKAKHPLLIFRYMDFPKIGNEPVPIDIELCKDTRAIIISGPNAGGKTVTLKTVGLLQLMMQSGLQIPAGEGSELGIFEEVLADIGDEQDISKGLSSFSSHITNMVRIIERIRQNSICLLDELGSDTDPSEGAALGIAILEYILEKEAFCLITTHHNGLKAYASMHPQKVRNASMGFDTDHIAPTYKIHIGYPGESNALDICAKLGIPLQILERARDIKGEGEIKLSSLLNKLNQEEMRLRQELEKQEALRKEIESIKVRYNHLKESIEERNARIAKEAQSKVKNLVERGRKEVDRIVNESKISNLTRNSVKNIHNELKEVVQNLTPSTTRKSNVKPIDIRKVKKGEPIFITGFKQQGRISRIDLKEQRIWVVMGNLRFKVKAEDLYQAETNAQYSASDIKVNFVASDISHDEISPKIMVIGQRVEEALLEIDRYIDNAIVAHLSQVAIIHGKGTGALQKAIEKFLLSHPQVVSFRSGNPQEGGTGVTVVELAA